MDSDSKKSKFPLSSVRNKIRTKHGLRVKPSGGRGYLDQRNGSQINNIKHFWTCLRIAHIADGDAEVCKDKLSISAGKGRHEDTPQHPPLHSDRE